MKTSKNVVQQSAVTMQNWTFALRREMGYPDFGPSNDTIAFGAGGCKSLIEVMQVAGICEDMRRDMVYVGFGEPILAGPIEVSLAIRQTVAVDWHPGVRLYAASPSAPIELLTEHNRWFIGPRHVLTAAPLPPRSKIEAGVKRAMRRWCDAVESIGKLNLTGSILVPQGATYAMRVSLDEALNQA